MANASVNDGNTTTTTPGAMPNWYQPSEAKRDKAGGKHTALTVKMGILSQTVRFSVGIAISEVYTSNNSQGQSSGCPPMVYMFYTCTPSSNPSPS